MLIVCFASYEQTDEPTQAGDEPQQLVAAAAEDKLPEYAPCQRTPQPCQLTGVPSLRGCNLSNFACMLRFVVCSSFVVCVLACLQWLGSCGRPAERRRVLLESGFERDLVDAASGHARVVA